MTLNASGPISLGGTTSGQSIQVELGGNGTTQISLFDIAVRTLAGVPSGAITMPTNFWGKSKFTPFVALAEFRTSPGNGIVAWPWSNSTGFGTRYTDPGLNADGYFTDVHPTNKAIAIGCTTDPKLNAYAWNDGFSTKYVDAASMPGNSINAIKYSPSGNYVAACGATVGSRVRVYPWSNVTGFGTVVIAGPDPTNHVLGCSWRPQEDALAVSSISSPFINAWAWSAGSFGSKYANPGTLPGGFCTGLNFSPNGNQIVAPHINSPYVAAYTWSSGFGSKLANPATLPPQYGLACDFTPDGAVVITVGGWFDGTTYANAYAWSSSGFGTKYANFSPAFTAKNNGVAFNSTGTSVAIARDNSPFISAFPWSNDTGFGTKFTDPAVVTNTTNGITPTFSK